MDGSQKVLKGHIFDSNKIIDKGKDQVEYQSRVCDTKMLISTTVPNLSIMSNKHKKKDSSGDPQSSPVCGAGKSINGENSY